MEQEGGRARKSKGSEINAIDSFKGLKKKKQRVWGDLEARWTTGGMVVFPSLSFSYLSSGDMN